MASNPKLNQLGLQPGGSLDGASRFCLAFVGNGDCLDWNLERVVAQAKLGMPDCDGDMFALLLTLNMGAVLTFVALICLRASPTRSWLDAVEEPNAA